MKLKNLSTVLLAVSISSCATFSGSHPSKVENAKKALEKNISILILKNNELIKLGETVVELIDKNNSYRVVAINPNNEKAVFYCENKNSIIIYDLNILSIFRSRLSNH